MRSKIRGRNGNAKFYKDPSKRPTMLDIAWAAGIIEGEGNFTIESHGTSGRVCANQKDPEILYRLQEFFGGSVIFRPGRASNILSDNGVYVWTLAGARGAGVMLTIFSWLSAKRRLQVRKVIEYLVTNSEWRRFRMCEACGAEYMPWKRSSRTCSTPCYGKLPRINGRLAC